MLLLVGDEVELQPTTQQFKLHSILFLHLSLLIVGCFVCVVLLVFDVMFIWMNLFFGVCWMLEVNVVCLFAVGC